MNSCLFCGDPEPKEWVRQGQGQHGLLIESLADFCTAFDLNDPEIYIDLLTSSTLCGPCIQGILDLGCLVKMIQRLEEKMVKVKTELRLKIEEQWLLEGSSGYYPPLVTSLYMGILGRLSSTVTDIDMDEDVAVKDELLSDTEMYQEHQDAFLSEDEDETLAVSSRILRSTSSFKGRKRTSSELNPDYILPELELQSFGNSRNSEEIIQVSRIRRDDVPLHENLFKCPLEACDKTFRTEMELKEHLRYHRRKLGKEMTYSKLTDLGVAQSLALVKRGPKGAGDKDIKVCDDEHGAPAVGHAHRRRRRKHSIIKLSCDLCDYVTKIKRDLKAHISSAHPDHIQSHKCPLCNKIYIVKDYLEQHMKKCHSNEPQFKCTICHQSQGLQSSDAVQKHEKFHKESPNPFTCSTCSQVFSTTIDLRLHVSEHENPSKCPNEDSLKTFQAVGNRTEQTETNQFVCDQCGKSFHHATYLKQHQSVTHSSTRTFLCDLCPMMYKDKGRLKRHKNTTHFNIRPFQCTLCPKTFTSSQGLKTHEEIHSGLKNYPCELCRKKFSTKKNWRRHSRSIIHKDALKNKL